ncbi:1860_t:CDS:2 [Funneliformis mosseae]|uniref:1860_t:CDS:1 n=1 Tax=Funneliformis mosseae TaxID=27381 RepID=A0A9N9DQ15_FUNMO|nr:1860_t:CDS:2 [Funneliformis mosseae]
MPHNKFRVVLEKAFSSGKLQLPKEQLDESRTLYPGVPSNASIQVLGQPLHDSPDGSHKAPDLAVYPHPTFVPDPLVPHPGPPPSDRRGNPYARVILEVAVDQSSSDLRDKCRLWKRQSERAMKATLWRQGVAKQKWHFGTLDKNGNHFPLGTNVCNTANDPNFIINIPVADIFYDPPIPAIGYTPLAGPPPALYNAIVAIDLYEVQQAVLMKQAK